MLIIDKNKSGFYEFRLKSESGNTLLKSKAFSTKKEFKRTINTLKTQSESTHRIERKTNHEGKFLFSLKDAEGNTIGESAFYTSEAGLENGIKNFKNRLSFI